MSGRTPIGRLAVVTLATAIAVANVTTANRPMGVRPDMSSPWVPVAAEESHAPPTFQPELGRRQGPNGPDLATGLKTLAADDQAWVSLDRAASVSAVTRSAFRWAPARAPA